MTSTNPLATSDIMSTPGMLVSKAAGEILYDFATVVPTLLTSDDKPKDAHATMAVNALMIDMI